ncbi:MAG: DUF3604 domain-containing protein [Pseudomonadales bacterium]
MRRLTIAAAALLLTACGQPAEKASTEATAATAAEETGTATAIRRDDQRNAYFGDLHVHTMYSFDAYVFGTRTDPNDAYAFAKGGVIKHATGRDLQLSTPLDFEAVTDHATYLGMLPAMFDDTTGVYNHPMAKSIREAFRNRDRSAFSAMLPYIGGQVENDDLLDKTVVGNTWNKVAQAAEANYEPGKFTTFIGYEYTSSGPEMENLHRNVIFAGSGHADMPFTRLDSTNPEDLWDWMDAQRAAGNEVLAIPHNSNGSNGMMFQDTTFDGGAMDAGYADQRMRNEPVVEVTQVKGTSDTHPLLSPNDEWADFEIMNYRIASTLPSQAPGSYVRDAYLRGLAMEAEKGFNPYRFGLIGSSDTHNSAGSFDDDNYWSKTGLLDATPQQRGSVPMDKPGTNGEEYADSVNRFWGASGLAGVWAESNTREDIFSALQRKETFATTGPHMKVRFFAGLSLPEDMATRADAVEQGYAAGVPMGGDLLGQGTTPPAFLPGPVATPTANRCSASRSSRVG